MVDQRGEKKMYPLNTFVFLHSYIKRKTKNKYFSTKLNMLYLWNGYVSLSNRKNGCSFWSKPDINVTKPRLKEQNSLVPNYKRIISIHYCYSIGGTWPIWRQHDKGLKVLSRVLWKITPNRQITPVWVYCMLKKILFQ